MTQHHSDLFVVHGPWASRQEKTEWPVVVFFYDSHGYECDISGRRTGGPDWAKVPSELKFDPGDGGYAVSFNTVMDRGAYLRRLAEEAAAESTDA